MVIATTKSGFEQQFACEPTHVYFSPGRVNLIGEYTDFNGGSVLPAALDIGTSISGRLNGTQTINVFSEAFGEPLSMPVESLANQSAAGHWTDYIRGSLAAFADMQLPFSGLDIYIAGNLPLSSGLSSSASLVVGITNLINDVWEAGLDRIELIQLAKSVENNFVGVNCGIMDQFAVSVGKPNHCLCLDCASLEWELVPLRLDGYELVITDSRVPRQLANSAYNDRHTECSTATKLLKKHAGIEYLCAATMSDLESCDTLRALPVEYRRARHVISENLRVAESVKALSEGNLNRFGDLLVESHRSLQSDFEVSCPELDILVDTALQVPGVLGSRMTGAGFGGCTVSLIAEGAVPEYVTTIKSVYNKETSYDARIIRCNVGSGVRRVV
jgi:galactokinase